MGLEDLSTYDIFLLFRRRATRNLCGSGVLARVTKYSPGQREVNVPLCVFYAGDPAGLAVTYRGQAVIRLFDLSERCRLPKLDLLAHLFQVEDPDGRVELLKVAFSEGRDVAALYSYTPHFGNGGPMVREAIAASEHILKLVVFKYTPPSTEKATNYSGPQEVRDILIPRGTEPVGLAIGNNGLVCIAWSRVGHRQTARICLYARDSVLMDSYGYDPSPMVFTLTEDAIRGGDPPLICNMQFTCDGSQLNLYTIRFPIHRFAAETSIPLEPYPTMTCYQARITAGPFSTHLAYVGKPFYYHHVQDVPIPSNTHSFGCVTTFTAVAVTIENWGHLAFIVECSMEHEARDCVHQPRRIGTSSFRDWNALARLDGFELDVFNGGHSTLGNILAISPRGTRIALSDWAKVRVWAVVPNAVQTEGLELTFPAEDFCEKTRLGILRHVELPSRGVIHSMCWNSEDQLYAMTDRGLVRWDVGPMACGRAESLSSDFEF